MTTEATPPDTAPAMKLSTKVEVWFSSLRDLDLDLGGVLECGGSRKSVSAFRTVS